MPTIETGPDANSETDPLLRSGKPELGNPSPETDSDDCTAPPLVHGHKTDAAGATWTPGPSTAAVTKPEQQQPGIEGARDGVPSHPWRSQHAAGAQGTRWSSAGGSWREPRRPKRSGCSRGVKSRRSRRSRSWVRCSNSHSGRQTAGSRALPPSWH